MRRSVDVVLVLTAVLVLTHVASAEGSSEEMSSMSIVGFDPDTGDVGIALASKFFAVAPIAAHVRADVGAVATMGGAPHR